MRTCAVCKKKFAPGTGTLFLVPNDVAKKAKWSKICGKNFTATASICEDHFLPTSIIRSGKKVLLLPNAEPILKLHDIEISAKKRSDISITQSVCSDQCEINEFFQPSHVDPAAQFFTWDERTSSVKPMKQNEKKEQTHKKQGTQTIKYINHAASKEEENVIAEEVEEEEYTTNLLNLESNYIPPQLQEEPIIHMPVIKSEHCAGSTQTNTRLCGLVQASGHSDEFWFNCFYCCAVYPLEKWKNFVYHLKEKHTEIEEALKMLKYVSVDHDYTPINLPSSTPLEATTEKIVIKTEPLSFSDPLETAHCQFESIQFNSKYDKTLTSDNKNISNNFIETDSSTTAAVVPGITNILSTSKKERKYLYMNTRNATNNSMQKSKKTALSRCLKRTNVTEVQIPADKEQYESVSIEIVQQSSTEIGFDFTPRDIIDLLLDSMKKYPVLWQYDYAPFNEDFYEAAEDLCKIINDKWSLSIDNLKMRRSINRIIRFYCCSLPNGYVENFDKFADYFNKCATFLPSSVSEIAYARCSHCYMCYGNDFDLKRHLVDEQKYLQWPYECAQCKECFRESDEYEFHKLLPHYDEIFKCKSCNESFELRNKYKQHMSKFHPKDPNDLGEHKCNICGKAFHSRGSLSTHKLIHGERKYKCHLCSKSYFVNSALTHHLKRHRKEYDFICEVCGKEFLMRSYLRQHMKKHTGAKVTCNICNLKLRKSSLSRHLRLVHVAYEGTLESTFRAKCYHYNKFLQPQSIRPKKKRCKGRKFYCKICKINFENYKLCKEHNKEVHGDVPMWPCKMCSGEFSSKVTLSRHYRKEHKISAIPVFKWTRENQDLNVALNEVSENRDASSDERNIKKSIKPDLLPDEIFFGAEKIHSSTIQEEIMKSSDIIKIDYFNELITDFLEE